MEPITPAQIRRILEVTDALCIHREAVTIPLAREGSGRLERVAGSKIQITAPEGGIFESWLAALAGQIGGLDLSGVLRTDDGEE
ncbi:MAG: hypothetical protein SGI90_11670 [Candidatus Eisenbacteria bacterium]|nr:hypothetical protein [Candidatus Eisenbacteria bacterium]